VKPLRSSDFPELRRVFSGYLHEDFLDEYGAPATALRAFLEEADSSERLRFRTEVRRFLECTAPLDLKDARALIARLGCRWVPSSRRALRTLLAEIVEPAAGKPQT
jgi:hypothetical protein